MLLKTVQPISIIEQINSQNPIIYSMAKNIKEYDQWSFYEAYEWLKTNKMQSIGNVSPTNEMLWAWEYSTNQNKLLADEMIYHQISAFNGKCVALTIYKPDNEVLLSDHSLWEYVLNYWAIPSTKDETKMWEELETKGISFYEQKPLHHEYHQIVEKSWQQAFQLKLNPKTNNYNFSLPKHTLKAIGVKKEDCLVQATFWDIKMNEIQHIQYI